MDSQKILAFLIDLADDPEGEEPRLRELPGRGPRQSHRLGGRLPRRQRRRPRHGVRQQKAALGELRQVRRIFDSFFAGIAMLNFEVLKGYLVEGPK